MTTLSIQTQSIKIPSEGKSKTFNFPYFYPMQLLAPSNVTMMAAGHQSHILEWCCGERLTKQNKPKMMNFPTKITLLVYM